MNLVNSRHHTPLDVGTFSWITHERQTKINRGTNNLAVVDENKVHVNFNSCPDVSSSPLPSPLLQRSNSKLITRTDSSSSWVYVDKESASSSPVSNGADVEDAEMSQRSSEDSREFTSSVMPIKSADLVDEGLNGTAVSSPLLNKGPSLLKLTETILNLLYSVHSLSGKAVKHRFRKMSLLTSLSDSDEFQQRIDSQKRLNPFREKAMSDVEKSVKIRDFVEGKTVFSLYEELEYNINMRLESHSSLSNPDEAISIALQQRELVHFKKTSKEGIGFEVNGGSRLLFLDGGGIKGLVQVEVMRQLEEATGKKITELFDWIIGSSIGGILAMGLVYGEYDYTYQ